MGSIPKSPYLKTRMYLDLRQKPKTMAQYPKIENMGSIGSIILATLVVYVVLFDGFDAVGGTRRLPCNFFLGSIL